jgi:putative salt-induced outer membrane protein
VKNFFIVLTLSSLVNLAFAVEIKNESEAGVSVANGNTKAKTYNLKQESSFVFDENTLKLQARYLNAYSNNVESARYILGALRYERALSERVSLIAGQGYESDKFAGYDFRHNSDIGAKYNIVKEEKFYWFLEAGYRYTNEKRLDGSHVYSNSLRGYTETEKKWNENVSTKYYIEYVPSLDESKDYLINTELSLSAALDSTFSIKSSYLVRYDHLPAPGTSTRTDTLLSTALVAKF